MSDEKKIIKVRQDGTMYIKSKDFFSRPSVQKEFSILKKSGILKEIKSYQNTSSKK